MTCPPPIRRERNATTVPVRIAWIRGVRTGCQAEISAFLTRVRRPSGHRRPGEPWNQPRAEPAHMELLGRPIGDASSAAVEPSDGGGRSFPPEGRSDRRTLLE